MKDTKFEYLFEKNFNGQATIQERGEFLDFVEDRSNKQKIEELMESYWSDLDGDQDALFSTIQRERMLTSILIEDSSEPKVNSVKLILWPRIVAAVALAIVISGVVFFYHHKNSNEKTFNQVLLKNDIEPGKSGATLTLADGRKIKLTDAVNGEIAKESGISISKTSDGQVIYKIQSGESIPNRINTLSTGRGETYVVTLPDQSKVWLNASSSLTYTSILLQAGVRKVKLLGEAYFEISKDKLHPFVVESAGQMVKVLGTHFNINSYPDENDVKTTLVEGIVNVNGHILRPNEQAINTQGEIRIRPADIESDIAWKNGDFIFDHEDFESIIRKIEKWYNVEFIYSKGRYTNLKINGSVSRSKNISSVLDALQQAGGISFRIEGRRITII